MGQLGLRLVNIALFTLICFLTAGVVNQIVEARLAPDYFALTPHDQVQTSARPDWDERKVILDRNLFGAQVAMPPKQAEAPTPPPIQIEEPVVETKLPLKLVGTMAAIPTHLSSAVIQNTRRSRDEVVQIGDHLEDHDSVTVVAIEPRRVVLENAGKREELVLEEKSPDARVAAAPSRSNDRKPRARRPRSTRGRSINTRRSLNERSSSAAEPSSSTEERITRKAQSILQDAKIMPSYDDDGGMQGFSVDKIEPDSFLERAGLQNGDVITSVNGIEIDNPSATTRVFSALKDMSSPPVIEVMGADDVPRTIEPSPEEFEELMAD